jgi:hypothetical protein
MISSSEARADWLNFRMVLSYARHTQGPGKVVWQFMIVRGGRSGRRDMRPKAMSSG